MGQTRRILLVSMALVTGCAEAEPSACGAVTPALGAFALTGCLDVAGVVGAVSGLDWNGDGMTDLIVTGEDAALYLGPITGEHVEAATSLLEVGAVNAGDIDGDGADELLIWSPAQEGVRSELVSSGFGVLGTWEQDEETPPIGAGDVDGDGLDDLLVLPDRLHFGHAGGDWTPGGARSIPLPESELRVPIGDIDGDGWDDLGRAGVDGGPLYWAPGAADELVEAHHLEVDGHPIAVGDVDGDGLDDIVAHDLVPDDGMDDRWLSAHYGVYFGPEPWGVPLLDPRRIVEIRRVTAGDVNGDGFSDVLIVGGAGFADRASLFLGSPPGLSPTASWTRTGVDATLVGDLDGDGRADMVIVAPPEAEGWRITVLSGRACADDIDCDGVLDVDDCAPYAGEAWTGAPEACDGQDNDCDGLVDEDHDLDADGWAWCAGDCDDDDPSRMPQGEEVCNGVDDDCDGWTDEAPEGWFDGDYDGVPRGCDADDSDPDVGLEDEGREAGAPLIVTLILLMAGLGAGTARATPLSTNNCSPDSIFAGSDWGPFEAPTCITSRLGPTYTDVLDWNGDGIDDLYIGGWGCAAIWGPEDPYWMVDGSLSGLETEASVIPWPTASAGLDCGALSVGDTDGDGYDELFIGETSYVGSNFCQPGTWSKFSSFGVASSGSVSGYWSSPIAVGDVNGDGLDQIGSWGYSSTFGYYDKPIGDADGNGRADLADTYPYLPVQPGGWDPALGTMVPHAPLAYAGVPEPVGDVNGDGYDDVALILDTPVARGALGPAWVTMHYGGPSGLTPGVLFPPGPSPADLVPTQRGDINGDGYSDVLFWSPTGWRVHLGTMRDRLAA